MTKDTHLSGECGEEMVSGEPGDREQDEKIKQWEREEDAADREQAEAEMEAERG